LPTPGHEQAVDQFDHRIEKKAASPDHDDAEDHHVGLEKTLRVQNMAPIPGMPLKISAATIVVNANPTRLGCR